MTTEAQNAFLETLEEPPPDALLLSLTSKPDELLPTTLSRVIEMTCCQKLVRADTEHERKLLALLKARPIGPAPAWPRRWA